MQCPLVYIGSLVVNVAAAVRFEVLALTCGRAITHAADTESRRCERGARGQPENCGIARNQEELKASEAVTGKLMADFRPLPTHAPEEPRLQRAPEAVLGALTTIDCWARASHEGRIDSTLRGCGWVL